MSLSFSSQPDNTPFGAGTNGSALRALLARGEVIPAARMAIELWESHLDVAPLLVAHLRGSAVHVERKICELQRQEFRNDTEEIALSVSRELTSVAAAVGIMAGHAPERMLPYLHQLLFSSDAAERAIGYRAVPYAGRAGTPLIEIMIARLDPGQPVDAELIATSLTECRVVLPHHIDLLWARLLKDQEFAEPVPEFLDRAFRRLCDRTPHAASAMLMGQIDIRDEAASTKALNTIPWIQYMAPAAVEWTEPAVKQVLRLLSSDDASTRAAAQYALSHASFSDIFPKFKMPPLPTDAILSGHEFPLPLETCHIALNRTRDLFLCGDDGVVAGASQTLQLLFANPIQALEEELQNVGATNLFEDPRLDLGDEMTDDDKVRALVRESAVEVVHAVAQRFPEESLPYLIAGIDSSNRSTRILSLAAIGVCGTGALPHLGVLLEWLRGEDVPERRAAALAMTGLKTLAQPAADAISEAIVKEANRGDEPVNNYIRYLLEEALIHSLVDENVLPSAITSLLFSQQNEVREAGARVAQRWAIAMNVTIRMRTHEHEELHHLAAAHAGSPAADAARAILMRSEKGSEETLSMFLASIEGVGPLYEDLSTDDTLRRPAIDEYRETLRTFSARRYNSPEAVASLVKALGKLRGPNNCFSGNSLIRDPMRWGLIEKLNRGEPVDECHENLFENLCDSAALFSRGQEIAVFDYLMTLLEQSSESEQQGILALCSRLIFENDFVRLHAAARMKIFLPFLHSASGNVRCQCCVLLGNIGEPAIAAKQDLFAMARADTDIDARGAALAALAGVDPADQRTLDLLKRQAAFWAICDAAVNEKLLARVRYDMVAVYVGLARAAKAVPEFVGHLEEAISHRNDFVRFNAAFALRYMVDSGAAARLLDIALSDEDQQVRRTAVWSLGSLGPKGRARLGQEIVLARDSSIRSQAISSYMGFLDNREVA